VAKKLKRKTPEGDKVLLSVYFDSSNEEEMAILERYRKLAKRWKIGTYRLAVAAMIGSIDIFEEQLPRQRVLKLNGHEIVP